MGPPGANDRGELASPGQGPLTTDKRAELVQLRLEKPEVQDGNGIFQAGCSALCQGAAAAEKFSLID